MGLGDVLGFNKSATFNATVQIHELAQVPLLHAKFRIKWKFKGATYVSGQDADDPNASSFSLSHSTSSRHGFGKRFLHPRAALHNVSSTLNNATFSSSGSSPSGGGGMTRSRSGSPRGAGRYDSDDTPDEGSGGLNGGYPVSPSRSPPLSPDARTPNPNRTPGPSNFAFTSPFSAGGTETVYAHGRQDTAATEDTLNSSTGTAGRRRGGGDLSAMLPAAGGGGHSAHRPEPKGCTTYIPLRQHTATFNREISCPVQIPLRHLPSSSLSAKSQLHYQLQPSPVRLSVKQETPGEDGKKGEERLGEVILDLSQFVGQKAEDVKPRRYLLQGCKSNAVIRVTVKMELVEGDAKFVAPPLRSGQVPTNAAVAKGLASSQNSPMNRSTVSLSKPSAGRLSTSTAQTTSTSSGNGRPGSVGRANSISSMGSSQSQSQSLLGSGAGSMAGSREQLGGLHRTESAAAVNGGRNGRGKKKGWHPPTSALSLTFSSTPAPSLFPSFSTPAPNASHTGASASSNPERSASDIVDTIFNRPQRQPSWVGFSAASRGATPNLSRENSTLFPASASAAAGRSGSAEKLGEPFELRGESDSASASASAGGGRRGMFRRSAPPTVPTKQGSVDSAEGLRAGGKAWSIKGGMERRKERHRERDRKESARGEDDGQRAGQGRILNFEGGREEPPRPPRAADFAATEAPADRDRDRDRREAEDARRKARPQLSVQPPTPQLNFQPPTPQPSFTGSTRPPRPQGQPPPPPNMPSSGSSRPPSVASNGRALSVRWGDAPSNGASAPSMSSSLSSASHRSSSSNAATTVPSSDRRSLRHKSSADSALSSFSFGGRSARSTRDNPGLGLSERTPSPSPSPSPSPHTSASPSPATSASATPNSTPQKPARRPPSQLSFNSVVTPPSPVKRAVSHERQRSGGSTGSGMAPGGVEWRSSWVR
ncbi:hypothetical protein JCM10207_008391 [Rhodosporidiobolus poonsookiae]